MQTSGGTSRSGRNRAYLRVWAPTDMQAAAALVARQGVARVPRRGESGSCGYYGNRYMKTNCWLLISCRKSNACGRGQEASFTDRRPCRI